MKIKIELAMPQQIHPALKSPTVCAKVMEAMNTIESGYEPNDEEWKYLRKVQEQLQNKPKRTPPMQRLLDKIDNFMIKYGKHAADSEHAGEVD